jgi:hypothetical protein
MANAFNNSTINNLQNNVRTLYYRRRMVGKLILTNEEYIQTFVPVEARDMFRDIAPLVATERYNHKFELRLQHDKPALNAYLHMSEVGVTPPVPRVLHIQRDAPKEIIERMVTWSERGGDVSREFGRVSKVLEILNHSFSRVAIRYYWPTILAICSESDATKPLVQELQELRAPAKLKQLPPGLARAMRLTAETVATARLIPTDVDKEERINAGEVLIDIASGQQYTEEFGYYWGLA